MIQNGLLQISTESKLEQILNDFWAIEYFGLIVD